MTAAILSPGPSLYSCTASLWRYDFTIGVNRAPFVLEGRRVEVDGWCFDSRAMLTRELDYQPILCCSAHDLRCISEAGRRGPTFTHETMLELWPGSLAWCDFSATSAITLAAHLGATEIDCYGSDWTNSADADGVSLASNNRNDARWVREAGVWKKLTDYLRVRGVRIRKQ